VIATLLTNQWIAKVMRTINMLTFLALIFGMKKIFNSNTSSIFATVFEIK
jgi:hypothetical protein